MYKMEKQLKRNCKNKVIHFLKLFSNFFLSCLTGSPFEFTVGPITGGGAHKVHAAGPGLEKGEVLQPCKLLPLVYFQPFFFFFFFFLWSLK